MSKSAPEVLVVEPDLAGVRLHDLLARHWPDVHRGELRQLVASGEVSVNGEACLSDRRMRVGDVVLFADPGALRRRPHAAGASVDAAPLDVLLETASVIVVDKPAGVPSVPDRSGRELGVHGKLAELRPDDDLRIVHRLDRNTSGCLVLAKGLDAARHFDEQLQQRAVQKTYVALVAGVPRTDEMVVEHFLGPDRRRPGKVVASANDRRGFREARTELRVRTRFRRHALLELSPRTGRGHQLRVHLQTIGHPIVGDTDYGGERLLLSRLKPDYKKRPGVAEQPLLQRMFLHAEQIAFVDLDGRAISASSPLPKDLAVALQKVEKHASTSRSTQCD